MQDHVINAAEEFAEQHNFNFEVFQIPVNEFGCGSFEFTPSVNTGSKLNEESPKLLSKIRALI
jgi:hypothetical protein